MTSPYKTFASLLYKTNRFHVAVSLFSNRSQKASKCGKNISDTRGAIFVFLHVFVLGMFTFKFTTSVPTMDS